MITVIQQDLFDEKRSKVGKYRELVVGQRGLWPLVRYELVMLLASCTCAWGCSCARNCIR